MGRIVEILTLRPVSIKKCDSGVRMISMVAVLQVHNFLNISNLDVSLVGILFKDCAKTDLLPFEIRNY